MTTEIWEKKSLLKKRTYPRLYDGTRGLAWKHDSSSVPVPLIFLPSKVKVVAQVEKGELNRAYLEPQTTSGSNGDIAGYIVVQDRITPSGILVTRLIQDKIISEGGTYKRKGIYYRMVCRSCQQDDRQV